MDVDVTMDVDVAKAIKEEQASNVEQKDQEEPIILLAYKEESEKKDTWYLDTGVRNHKCGFKNMFVELESESGHVTFGDE